MTVHKLNHKRRHSKKMRVSPFTFGYCQRKISNTTEKLTNIRKSSVKMNCFKTSIELE